MKILYTGPSGITEEFATESETVLLGRNLAPLPDRLDLKDGKVSSQHALISLDRGELWIEDLGSTNGTWINKKKISSRTRLKPESTIRVGQTTLKVEAPSQAPLAAPGPEVESPLETVEAAQPLPDLFLAGASFEAARLRLSAVYELCASLGEIETVEALGSALLDHLQRAFPRIGRGGHSGFSWAAT